MAGGFGNPPGAIYGLPGSARDARFGLTNPNHRERRKTVRGDGMFKKLTAEGAEIHREFILCVSPCPPWFEKKLTTEGASEKIISLFSDRCKLFVFFLQKKCSKIGKIAS